MFSSGLLLYHMICPSVMADLLWVFSLGVFFVRFGPCCEIGLMSCSRHFVHFLGPFLNHHQGPYFALCTVNFMYPSGMCPTAYALSPAGAGSLLISHLNRSFGAYIRGQLCPFLYMWFDLCCTSFMIFTSSVWVLLRVLCACPYVCYVE